MRKTAHHATIPALALCALAGFAGATIPLPASPTWTSNSYDYSTGGGVADVDGNGLLDLLTSNGNDMAQDRNGVYLDSAGTFRTYASWRSTDLGYFGHCYAGDVDNDGRPDLAVAYLGSGNSGDHLARIYRNEGGILGTSPYWKAHDRHSSFDCCLGDFDLDGDLDLAIATGDAYAPIEYDRTRIYRNNAGTFDTLPCWSARDTNPADAARFCDLDDDGDLDLFLGQVVPGTGGGKVTMYRNQNGVLDTMPFWTARAGVGWVLRLAFGDYDNDGFPDLAVASNNQQGEPNSIKVFHNNAGTLDTIARFTMLRNRRYSSCVAWADVNGDGFSDLAAGGWWEPAVVFENDAGVLDTAPTWSWSPTVPQDLVCEAVVWGSVGNTHIASVADAFSGTGQRKLFNLRSRPVQFLDSVTVNGTPVPPAGFCYDALVGWVSFAATPPSGTDNVVVYYRRSTHPDLVVTNWEPSYGNLMFRNSTPVGAASQVAVLSLGRLIARPNPFRISTAISLSQANDRLGKVDILDASGRLVRTLAASGITPWVRWDGRNESGSEAGPGVYFAAAPGIGSNLKLVRIAGN
jgi:hypothetical protein